MTYLFSIFYILGDDFGNLSLFNYPCVVKDAPRNVGFGHSSHVMNVKFTSNGRQLITVGGNDGSIIVWKLIENYNNTSSNNNNDNDNNNNNYNNNNNNNFDR